MPGGQQNWHEEKKTEKLFIHAASQKHTSIAPSFSRHCAPCAHLAAHHSAGGQGMRKISAYKIRVTQSRIADIAAHQGVLSQHTTLQHARCLGKQDCGSGATGCHHCGSIKTAGRKKTACFLQPLPARRPLHLRATRISAFPHRRGGEKHLLTIPAKAARASHESINSTA